MKISSNEFRILRKASKGVTRVTEQMSDLVYNIAYEISGLGQIDDSVDVAGETLQIAKIKVPADDTEYNYLMLRSQNNYTHLYGTKTGKWGNEYLTDSGYLEDPEMFKPATREQKIWFLQHVAEIIRAFTALWKEQEEKITLLLSKAKVAIERISEESK